MFNLFRKLVNAGNLRSTPPERRKWIRLSNISSLLAMLGFVACGAVFLFIGSYTLASLALLVGLIQLGLPFLNQQGINQPSWLFFQFLNAFFVFYFATTIGSQAPLYWFYIINVKTGLLYFYGRKYRWLKHTLLVYLAIIISLDIGFGWKPFGSHFISPEYSNFFSIFIPGLCLTLLILFIYYFVNETYKYSKKVEIQSKKIQEKNLELERLNEELDLLVYHAWHDLRAPIASAMGLINLAREETSMEVVQQYLHLQDKSLKKLDKLIRDLLDYKRNREIELKHESVNFEKEVGQALETCSRSEEHNQIEWDLIIDQDGTFHTDQARLEMILTNLISNAIQYSKPDDFKPWIQVKIFADKDQANIIIRDKGIGIREDLHDRIFDMFYRASNQSDGTGLGLYIVNETTQKLGGNVSLESIPGKGSTFKVSIPNLEPEPEASILTPQFEKLPISLSEIA